MSTLVCPIRLDELFDMLHYGAECVAGGTDWIIKRHGKLRDDSVVIDLSRLKELKGISDDGDFIRIGALETMTAIHNNPIVRKYAATLSDAAYVMGSEQIRNRATIGGNVANSSPAADTPGPLAALGAEACVISAEGERLMKIEEIIGRNKNNLSEGEIIKEFIIPKDEKRISAFLKIGSRTQVSISRINIAVSARPVSGVYLDARVYVGTLGSAARRCCAAEAALERPYFKETLPDVLTLFAAEAIPGRSTLPYKQSALRALALDICARLDERAGGIAV